MRQWLIKLKPGYIFGQSSPDRHALKLTTGKGGRFTFKIRHLLQEFGGTTYPSGHIDLAQSRQLQAISHVLSH